MKIMPLYFYADELLREVWVPWCEKILFNQNTNEYRTARGFQNKLHATSSTARTRADEIYGLGMLKAELVNRGRGGGRDVPLGWAMSYKDGGVLSRFGYIAYIIGRGLIAVRAREAALNVLKVERAFSSVCAIMLLQAGITYKKNSALTVSLFRYVLNFFKRPHNISEPIWERYVAAAMFCSLEDENLLLRNYFNSNACDELCFISDENKKILVSKEILERLIRERFSLSKIKNPKSSLFFIGKDTNGGLRGLYSKALIAGNDMIEVACNMERRACNHNAKSPFRAIAERRANHEVCCVMTELCKIYKYDDISLNVWNRVLNDLMAGVEEVMPLIFNKTSLPGALLADVEQLRADNGLYVDPLVRSKIIRGTYDKPQSESQPLIYPNVTKEDYDKAVKTLSEHLGSDKRILVAVRTEQNYLRKNLFKNKRVSTCGICGRDMPVELLITAHIKPRANCAIKERRDIHNVVMPMCRMGCDDLFGRGFISVDNGRVVISSLPWLPPAITEYFRVVNGRECVHWSESSKKYFEWHKANVFL